MTISVSRPSFSHIFLSLLAITAVTMTGCGQPDEQAGGKRDQEHLVEIATVVSDNLSVVRTRAGTLSASREVRIHAQEEGRLTALPFYEGDRVKAGDVVVQLDDTLLRVQLERASATRKQAAEDVKRLKELRGSKLISENEYTRAVTALEVAEADERLLQTRLGYTTSKAPFDGVVTERLSEPGNIIERHQHVLTIADPSSLLTELPVSELILPGLSLGDVARVRIDALGDRVFEGRIVRIFPNLDPLTRRGTIEVEIDPVPEGAAPGQLCRVELNTHAARRQVIPYAALRRDTTSEYVFLVDAESRAQRVDVESGLRLADKVEIRQGLQDGQPVVTRGFLGLASGKTVKPVDHPVN
ncbi:MAG TPA: efflux RND transporter periplasmic adaptor subunit [Gammaproteobacteria bacterium]|nr:efflux RND transporter periplasmic adaptor subunit [Gammaproteobacteria bacterium]